MSTFELLQRIHDDMKADVAALDGQPFDAKTVAAQFGNQGAAIAWLARILAESIAETPARADTVALIRMVRKEMAEKVGSAVREHCTHCAEIAYAMAKREGGERA